MPVGPGSLGVLRGCLNLHKIVWRRGGVRREITIITFSAVSKALT